MTENNKKISENTENKLLTDDQLENVSGGECIPTVRPVLYKRHSADCTDVDNKEFYEYLLNSSK